jgi:hypothetical protein
MIQNWGIGDRKPSAEFPIYRRTTPYFGSLYGTGVETAGMNPDDSINLADQEQHPYGWQVMHNA